MNAAIPTTDVTVGFDAKLQWEELKDGLLICNLRNPSLIINGTKIADISHDGKAYKIQVEIEGATTGDQMSIGAVVVGQKAYTDAIQAFVPNGTTTTMVAEKEVTWTWKDIWQPILTAIASEGDKIELKHTSLAVIIRHAWDDKGNPVMLGSLPQAWFAIPNGSWVLNHTVEVSP